MKKFDIICLGRAAVDLYAEERGTSLEAAVNFKKYLGGSSGNMAFGAARQGLKVAMLTRVGSDHMGRFVVRELQSAGVDVSLVQQDETRLTGLVILGMRNEDSFPLIFYRKDCADMAIEATFTKQQIKQARALVITGTHFSTNSVRAVSLKAIEYARESGVKVVLDIDYRPVLWGIGRPEEGESRFAVSKEVTTQLQEVFALCDVLVGTEEELHIGGGSSDTIQALNAVRKVSNATIVLKRGALGCQIFENEIPAQLGDVPLYGGVPVEVLNVLGAGDAFISGLLRGYIKKENKELDAEEESRNFHEAQMPAINWQRAANLGNACGAIVVSRHACAPAIPTKSELDYFIKNRNNIPRPDKDVHLQYLHRVFTRRVKWEKMAILAFDHRVQFVEMVDSCLLAAVTKVNQNKKIASSFLTSFLIDIANKNKSTTNEKNEKFSLNVYSQERLIEHIKEMIFVAFETIANSGSGHLGKVGLLCDHVYGKKVLAMAVEKQYWLAAPVEMPKASPLEFQPANVGLAMRQWAPEIIAKCLVFIKNDAEYIARMNEKLLQLWEAVLAGERELLLEVISTDGNSVVDAIEKIYELGIKPDWWKVTINNEEEWHRVAVAIKNYDPYCRGVLLLGLDGSMEEVTIRLQLAAKQKICKGFAVGRSFFGKPIMQWLGGDISDKECISLIAKNYGKLAFEFLK